MKRPEYIVAAAMAAYILVVTHLGIGVSPDSVTYLNSAENLINGKGLTVTLDGGRPLAHYPPLYPLMLSSLAPLGVQPAECARYLNALFFAASIVLIGHIIRGCTGSAAGYVLFGVLLFSLAETVVYVYAMAWTEGPFIFFMLLALMYAGRYLESGAMPALAASAAFSSLAMLTRYAGFSIALTVGALIIISGRIKAWPDKLKALALYGAISCLPSFLCMLKNKLYGVSAVDRQFAFHPVSVPDLYQLARTLLYWFLPDTLVEHFKVFRPPASVVAAVVLLLLAGATAAVPTLWKRRASVVAGTKSLCDGISGTHRVFISFAAVYMAFLVLTFSTVNICSFN